MTREEHRAKCLEAIKAGIPAGIKEAIWEECGNDETYERNLDDLSVKVLDSLHGIALVVSADWQCGDNYDCCAMDPMERADLTNPPEGKP